jgi:hypothetical protein
MALTPEERIALELIDRLETITVTEDMATVAVDVYRPNRDASNWTPADNTIVVVQGESAREPAMDCPGNPMSLAYAVTFAIVAFVRQDDRETDADATVINAMSAKIREAIAASSSDWYTFGDVAYHSEFGPSAPFPQTNDGHSGVIVEITCRFRVSEFDPTEVRA